MSKLFVDTSAWVAHFNRNDDFYPKAEKVFKEKPDLSTSNVVLHETVAHLSARVSKKVAQIAGDFILSGTAVQLISLSLQDEITAWESFKRTKFSLSFVDMSSVVLMQRLNLKEIFAFDKDFLKMGLKLIP